jgi:membrane-associated phospholipid phosphatase
MVLGAVGLCALPARSQQPEDARDRVLYSTETEHFKPLTEKLVKNVLMDQKDIWTSPFHIRTAEDAIPWILVGAGTAGLIASDHWTSRQLPNTVDQISISQDISKLGAGYTVVPIAAGFYIGGAFAHNEKARETGILGGEAIIDAAIVGEVVKLATQRQRPLDGNGNGSFFQGGSSFPSGHSAVSWALASVVAHEYNKGWYPYAAYGLASLVSLSRLSGQQHFPSDVLAGGAMGWFVGRYVFKTHLDHSIHTRPASKLSQLRPRVMPQFDSDTRGVVLSWGH